MKQMISEDMILIMVFVQQGFHLKELITVCYIFEYFLMKGMLLLALRALQLIKTYMYVTPRAVYVTPREQQSVSFSFKYFP